MNVYDAVNFLFNFSCAMFSLQVRHEWDLVKSRVSELSSRLSGGLQMRMAQRMRLTSIFASAEFLGSLAN